ncbi:glucans biosynthesis glucosyltransferase MdoH [Novipirellula maiorica]|nr:glucans biosynthesis glucosyltransferase MdoH [Rhodopirellula maiorica]
MQSPNQNSNRSGSAQATKWIRRAVFLWTLVATAIGTATYYWVIAGGNHLNVFELLSLPLFALLFGWIVFSFSLASLGFVCLWRRSPDNEPSVSEQSSLRDKPLGQKLNKDHSLAKPGANTAARTAILMPVYNESPHRVFAGIEAMLSSLRSIDATEQFDFYVLSDSTNHEIWLQEERAWSELLRRHGEDVNVYYRHRPKNVARKAGNIADFCGRWGSRYRYMIVLDADSLVDATTMVELVRRMEADDALGILQVPPTPVGRSSLFARLQQFSAHVYGPIFVAGFAKWAGDEGNYWGHNAIIRIKPFLRYCGLPVLPGKAPLGGEILSHDFVEAALMLRAGWKVQLATDLGGSFEECPTTIADYAQRDQRWCQGNLQHLRLLISEGFRPLSRLHFASGVMSYVASPVWILFTALCVIGTILDRIAEPGPRGPQFDSGALILFVVSMSLLLMPKFWSLLIAIRSTPTAGLLGGRLRLVASVLIEVVASVLLSPIMAIYHSRFVLATLRGTNVKWAAQTRDEQGVAWRDAIKRFGFVTLLSIGVTAALAFYAPAFLVWFSPLLAGLILSIPIDVAMGSQWLGSALRDYRILVIPEETSPSRLKRDHEDALSQSAATPLFSDSLFEQVIFDPEFFLLHRRIQLASEANIAMPTNQRKAIEAAWSTSGMAGIPAESRAAVLADAETLMALHLESQLK